ncbi:MAG: ATP cone domain-containing protein [Acidimicrobiales bacterium]
MRCPDCGGATRVLETRESGSSAVRRRRTCTNCSRRITTTEAVERDFIVKKRGGRTESFDASKLARAIGRAAHVLPVRGADINAIVDRIEKQLLAESLQGPLPSSRIGDLVLAELHGLGDATDLARIRFAMVFLGCSEGPGALSNARGFLSWLQENYPVPDSADIAEDAPPAVVLKRDGRNTEAFDIDKLMRSIEVALKGRGSEVEIRRIAFTLSQEVAESFEGQPLVTSLQIGSEVLKQLRERDGLAYLRFGATFKRITTPQMIALDARSVLAIEFDGVGHPSKGRVSPRTASSTAEGATCRQRPSTRP